MCVYDNRPAGWQPDKPARQTDGWVTDRGGRTDGRMAGGRAAPDGRRPTHGGGRMAADGLTTADRRFFLWKEPSVS